MNGSIPHGSLTPLRVVATPPSRSLPHLFNYLIRVYIQVPWKMVPFLHLLISQREPTMSGADPFFDSWHLMEFEQTEPFPVQDLAPTVPSQMGVSCWYPLPLVHRSPAAPSPSVEDSGLPPPGTNIPFDSRHRGTPSSRLEDSLASALHSRLHREETTYGRGTELRHESAPYSTYDQSISLPHAIDPRLLLSSTTPVINGPMGELPQVHIRETPPILDSSANGSANPAKNARFLRMHSKHRYECSWDDGSGKICGYSGTLREAKRHVKSVHPSSRCVLYH